MFADRCVDGIVAADRCRRYAESSPSVVTPLNRYIGYEEATKVAKQSLAEEKTIRDVVLERGYVAAGKLTEADLDADLDVLIHGLPHGSPRHLTALGGGLRRLGVWEVTG